MTRPWSLTLRDRARLEKMILATQPRSGEAQEYASVFKAPVSEIARIVADVRGKRVA